VPFTISDCVKNYSSGIISDAEGECGCSGQKENHAVTIVGFGQDTTLGNSCKKYWLVKNSWGTSWGERGFMRVCRDDDQIINGTCGIRKEAIIPIKGIILT
jgi:cathepsin L